MRLIDHITHLYLRYHLFLVRHRDPKNTEEFKQVHLLTIMVLSTGILMWSYAILACIEIRSWIPGVVGVVSSLVHILSPILFRTRLSAFAICNIAIGAGCSHQATFSFFSGGYESPTLKWFAVLPLLAGLVSGTKGAILWAFVTIVITTLFLLGVTYHYPLPYEISPLGQHLSNSFILYGFILLNTVMILVHVSIRSKTEETLKDQSEKIDTLFRILFHDLANSLGRLNFGVALMKRNDGTEKNQKGLMMASEATDTMLEITQNVKSMYAVSKGKTSIELGPTPLIETIEYVQRIFASDLLKKNISVEVQLERPDISIYVDPVSFKNQILANIFSNAIKFSPDHETITLKAKMVGDQVEIKIIDHGIGIPEHILKSMFDIHSKTSRPGTTGENGTGFGMVIMKSFMDLFEGSVQVSSVEKSTDHLRTGTVFTLLLKSR